MSREDRMQEADESLMEYLDNSLIVEACSHLKVALSQTMESDDQIIV